FDAEGFRTREGDVIVKLGELLALFSRACLRQRTWRFTFLKRIRSGHDVNGVDEKLGCDACLFFVFAEAKQAQSRNDDHGWIRIPEFRRIWSCKRLIVLLVGGAILVDLILDP